MKKRPQALSFELRSSKKPALGGGHPHNKAKRQHLATRWSEIAATSGAAAIVITNEVDDEALPIDDDFTYLENDYVLDSGIEKPDEGFLISCTCTECNSSEACSCIQASEAIDGAELTGSAYTQEGLFAFNVPSGLEVRECNKLCACKLEQCKNCMSQQPRDVAIEVFKKEQLSWGVRALVDIEMGKVLGVHTGLLIRRTKASAFREEDAFFCFDIDGDENIADPSASTPAHDQFTVYSKNYGNWTRFLNHSCTPNLKVYSCVHDTPPGHGMGFVSFVANQDIPAQTELMFDYDPLATEMVVYLAENGHGKGKKKRKAKASP
ncbi:hypothetical protein BDZ97DRAFT_1762100 [Flammula alnicola]|nr:hypothetical protein BDZ97DRAFT_1762100 [Flammula alnicola]